MEENNMQDKEKLSEVHSAQSRNADINSGNEEITGTETGQAENEEIQDVQEAETARLNQEIEELKDKYLRLVADFDNFRKRNARERLELIQTAGSDVITALLPVLDDCARAEEQLKTSEDRAAEDVAAVNQGVALIFNKLRSILQSRGLRPMESIGSEFNPEFHEAITEMPAPDPELKGKVLDEVEKGYYLNDKIIRFAKVVVGK